MKQLFALLVIAASAYAAPTFTFVSHFDDVNGTGPTIGQFANVDVHFDALDVMYGELIDTDFMRYEHRFFGGPLAFRLSSRGTTLFDGLIDDVYSVIWLHAGGAIVGGRIDGVITPIFAQSLGLGAVSMNTNGSLRMDPIGIGDTTRLFETSFTVFDPASNPVANPEPGTILTMAAGLALLLIPRLRRAVVRRG